MPLHESGEMYLETIYVLSGEGTMYLSDGGVEKLVSVEGIHTWRRWAKFGPMDFGTGAKKLTVQASGHGTLIFAVENSRELARVAVDADDFAEYAADLTGEAAGSHLLWVRFEGEDLAVRGFVFA